MQAESGVRVCNFSASEYAECLVKALNSEGESGAALAAETTLCSEYLLSEENMWLRRRDRLNFMAYKKFLFFLYIYTCIIIM